MPNDPDIHAVARAAAEEIHNIYFNTGGEEHGRHWIAKYSAIIARHLSQYAEGLRVERDAMTNAYQSCCDALNAAVDREKKAESERDAARAEALTWKNIVANQSASIETLQAERDAMRPVVEAAQRWRALFSTHLGTGPLRDLFHAIDAYRKGKP